MQPETRGVAARPVAGRPGVIALWATVTVLAGCDTPTATAPAAPPPQVEVFRCEHLLIAADSDQCTGDVIGPGDLLLAFRPDPKTASWEIALDGLTTLADECAFRGRFDQTRLAALQGRGEAEIVCPITDGVDRPYHTLYFETRDPTPGTTLRVRVVYQRPGR